MKPPKNSVQAPSLSDLIEIIRDPHQPTTPDISLPPESDDSNPLYMLNELVEKLESIIDTDGDADEVSASASKLHRQHPPGSTSEIERYIDLVQKQNAVLRKVMPKLH